MRCECRRLRRIVRAGNVWVVRLLRAALVSLLAAAACRGGVSTEASNAQRLARQVPPGGPGSRAILAAERIATVPSGTFGPYVGERPEGMIAVWAADAGGKRQWMTVGITDGIKPLGPPKEIAPAAADIDLVTVRPLGYGDARGFIVVASSREFSGEKIESFPLGLRGELTGEPAVIAQSLPDVVWVDAVQTPAGALAMWAVRREDRADIYGVELGIAGDVKTSPALLVNDVRAWQVLMNGGGAAIATVTAGKGRGAKGPLTLNFIDGHARVERRPLVVSDGATVDSDVDIARISDHLVMAWTDSTEIESRVYAALLDPRGSLLKPPAPLGQPFGPQEVLRIVPPVAKKAPAFLVWENLVERPATGRAVRVARLSSDGLLDPSSALVTISGEGGALPDFAGTPNGVAALTLAPACQAGRGCVGDRPVSTFVQLTEGMDVIASEPLRLASMNGAFADLAWGLTCRTGSCVALAVAPANPAPVLAMRLGGGAGGGWQPPARKVSASPPPRVGSIAALGKSDAVADVSATRTSAGSALAWVTEFDPTTPFTRAKEPAPDGKYEPPRAVLTYQAVPDEGPAPEPFVLSYRAHSVGGVATAPGDPAKGEVLVAWAGIDNKVPEVFLTLVGPGNKKIAQKMLTHARGGISDVTAIDVGDGWVVGWIQERNGAAEAHVAKVDRSLRPLVSDRHLGSAPSVASGIQLLQLPNSILAAWSDARGPAPGVADIYVRRLNDKDLVPLAADSALAQTASHSRSPVLQRLGDGAAAFWIEEPTPGSDRGATAMLAELDAAGNAVTGSVSAVDLAGAPRGIGATCGNGICRVVAAVAATDGGALTGFEWRRNRVEPRRLVALHTLPRDAKPSVVGDEVFYADEARPNDGRVRRLRVEWQ